MKAKRRLNPTSFWKSDGPLQNEFAGPGLVSRDCELHDSFDCDDVSQDISFGVGLTMMIRNQDSTFILLLRIQLVSFAL